MLVDAPARGLPGTIIDRVEMQRAFKACTSMT
jgi:hypothetical protein